jgi:hypothetical protein
VMISEATPSGMTCGDDFPSGKGHLGYHVVPPHRRRWMAGLGRRVIPTPSRVTAPLALKGQRDPST